MTISRLRPEFVEFVPKVLEDGVLYVSMKYHTVIHRCCCGCGNRVVTPLAPDEWSLFYDGVAVSLDPSIGNWSFPCQSHYWIRSNAVAWARKWSGKEIELGRRRDRVQKQSAQAPISASELKRGWWSWIKKLFR